MFNLHLTPYPKQNMKPALAEFVALMKSMATVFNGASESSNAVATTEEGEPAVDADKVNEATKVFAEFFQLFSDTMEVTFFKKTFSIFRKRYTVRLSMRVLNKHSLRR